MTLKEFKNLKAGDILYVPIIEGIMEYEVGSYVIGSHRFHRYTYRRIPVEKVYIHNYDPDGTESGWRKDFVEQFVKLDLSGLTKPEKDSFIETYSRHWMLLYWGYEDELSEYRDCSSHVQYDQDFDALQLKILSKNKKGADKAIKYLHKLELDRIDRMIIAWKNTKGDVREFLNKKPDDQI